MARQELAVPLEPVELLRHCAREPYVFLLDGGGPSSWGDGRALLGFRPRATLVVAADGTAHVRRGSAETRVSGDPFDLLEQFCRSCWPSPRRQRQAGVVLAALSYDLRQAVENVPSRHSGKGALLFAAYYDWVLAYSYRHRRYAVEADPACPDDLGPVTALFQEAASAAPFAAPSAPGTQAVPEMSRSEYEAAVSKALDYIAAGDVYQVNFAHRFRAEAAVSPLDLFSAMREEPAPFAAYVDGGDFTLMSNSPECFLTRRGSALNTFPIKGTRPRGNTPERDRLLAGELEQDAKECAEHVMIVDLERNDLGRVCRPGTVRVEQLGRVRTFPSVHHKVSRVTGELRPATTLAEILRATFPGGSITGAPKIRAMQIIDELEPVARGFYTGALGVVEANGDMVFNLMIRTAVADSAGVTYHAGGGIVADSVAPREYEETLVKAAPFFRALAGQGTRRRSPRNGTSSAPAPASQPGGEARPLFDP